MKLIEANYEIIDKENIDGNKILKDIEKVARTCYKSENNITDESAAKFVSGLIKSGHEAMLEHNIITVKFICDRGVSHEIVRHRVASYGQESTRYCDYSKGKFNNEINVISIADGILLDKKMKDLSIDKIAEIFEEWMLAMEDAERHYLKLIELGATPQIARGALPNSLKTEIVVSMNIREWRHFFNLRADIPAHPQMRELAIPLLLELSELIPVTFDDIVERLKVSI